jgi:hypothetical protein
LRRLVAIANMGTSQKREQADGAGGKKQELTEIVYESC